MHRVLGSMMKLEVRVTGPFAWLGPAWAALCGAVASGRLTPSGESLLFLLIVLFLVDVLWGTLWQVIAEGDWFVVSSSNRPLQVHETSSAALPYTAPGSLSHRIFGRLHRTRAWGRVIFWPRLGPALLGLVVTLPLALVLATILGQRVIILTLAASAIMLLALILARRSITAPLSLRAILEMGLAWLAGHTAFGPLSWWSFLLATLYVVAYHSYLKLPGNSEQRWLTLLEVSQAVVVVVLIYLRQPLVAGVVGLLLLPQTFLYSLLDQSEEKLWLLQRTRPFLMIGMLLAALAVR